MTTTNSKLRVTFPGSTYSKSVSAVGELESSLTTGFSQLYNNQRTGDSLPTWKSIIRSHGNATTIASSKVFRVHEQRAGHYKVYGTLKDTSVAPPYPASRLNTMDGNCYIGTNFISVPNGEFTGTSAYNQAVQKLYDRLQSFRNPAKTGEDFGEIKQTLNSLRRPFSSAQDLMKRTFSRGIKALSHKKGSTALKELADTYLEWKFGWDPLRRQIVDTALALQNRQIYAIAYPINATSGWLPMTVDYQEAANSEGLMNVPMAIRQTGRANVTFKGVWRNQVGQETRTISESMGLVPSQFFPTVWNLIPYSFLIDYFVNIDSFIDAYNTPWGGVSWLLQRELLEHYLEIQTKTLWLSATNPLAEWKTQISVSMPASFVMSARSSSRKPVTTLPMPTLEFSSKLSNVKATNILALIASQGIGRYQRLARERFTSNQPLKIG